MVVITLPQLLAAARAITARFGALPQVSTRDGRAWQCLALDCESGEHADSLPTVIDATPEGAVAGFIAAVHELGLHAADERQALLRSLADAYPAGVTVAAPELAAEVA